MNNFSIKCVGAFGIGLVIGFVSDHLWYRKKFEKTLAKERALLNERIEKQRKRHETSSTVTTEPGPYYDIALDEAESSLASKYDDISTAYNTVTKTPDFSNTPSMDEYRDYRSCYSTPTKVTDAKSPYVISPTEWGEYNDYDQIFLTCYADGVIAEDDNDIILEDPEVYLGTEWREHVGDWEEDIVSVRNEVYKIDYEIRLDNRNYSDVAGYDFPQEE